MTGSYLLNAALSLIFLISYLFCIISLDDALNDVAAYPHMCVFKNTVSMAAVSGLASFVILLIFADTVSFTSRQTWAFARDAGLPSHVWIAQIYPKLQVPVNAITVACLFTVLISLINFGSNVAFNAIISLNLFLLMLTYNISIGCALFRRMRHPELLPKARWSLGKRGVMINTGGLAYSLFAFFWCFWPNTTPVTATSSSWSVVMFLTVALVSTVDYWARARKVFERPISIVQGWRID